MERLEGWKRAFKSKSCATDAALRAFDALETRPLFGGRTSHTTNASAISIVHCYSDYIEFPGIFCCFRHARRCHKSVGNSRTAQRLCRRFASLPVMLRLAENAPRQSTKYTSKHRSQGCRLRDIAFSNALLLRKRLLTLTLNQWLLVSPSAACWDPREPHEVCVREV